MVYEYAYDAFGVEDEPDSHDANPFRYCGEYFDRESGKYYLRARYYDPKSGRFTQEDTHWNPKNMIYGDDPVKINEREDRLGLKHYAYAPDRLSVMQGGNLYGYCVGNPVFFVDKTGNQVYPTEIDNSPAGLPYIGIPLVIENILNIVTSLVRKAENGIPTSLKKAESATDEDKPSDKHKTVDDLLNDTEPGRETKGKSTQYKKKGGYEQALDDFNSLGVTDVEEKEDGTLVGKLPDGRTVNVRDHSSEGCPTLEIYNPVNKKSIKIRYIGG